MMLSTLSLASALVAIAAAQTASTTVSQSMPPTATAGFNANNVTSANSFLWCHAQLNTCPQICGGDAPTNTCNQQTLTYSCICGNGTEPDCTAYAQTLPFYICQETYNQCIANHPMDAEGQATCKSNEKCGDKNATALEPASPGSGSASSSSSAASSASATASQTSAAASSAASSASASAASTSAKSIANTQEIATGAFVAVLMAAFKLIL